jgi:hypothetical protein
MAKLSFPNWKNTILYQQDDIKKHLRKHPSLKSCLNETGWEAYEDAKKKISIEYASELVYQDLPVSMTFTIEEALYGDWKI